MSVLPSASVALDSLERDGDLGLQRVREHGSSSAIDAEAATRQQEEPQKPNSDSNSKKQRPKKVRIRQQLRRSCFLCPRGRGEVQHAIRVPCFQPEPDSAIYERLVAACYQYHGYWKKWIPFYGVVDVRETQFSFAATTLVPDRYEIYASPLAYDRILERCNDTLAQEPDVIDYDAADICRGGWHSMLCPQNRYEETQCLEDSLATARRIKKNLDMPDLMTKCAMDPALADRTTLATLGGMALETSPILQDRQIKIPSKETVFDRWTNGLLPGIQIVFGWQTHRVVDELPFTIMTTSFAVAVVWIGVVIGGLAGDWNLWVAIGQLLVASVTLLLVRLK